MRAREQPLRPMPGGIIRHADGRDAGTVRSDSGTRWTKSITVKGNRAVASHLVEVAGSTRATARVSWGHVRGKGWSWVLTAEFTLDNFNPQSRPDNFDGPTPGTTDSARKWYQRVAAKQAAVNARQARSVAP